MNAPAPDPSKRPLKILLSAYDCDPYAGSEPAHGWNWAYELQRAGHHVWVLTAPWGKPSIERFLKTNATPRLQMIYVDLPARSPFFGPFRVHIQASRWQRNALAAARKLDAQIDFDVVHHVTWGSLHIGSQLWQLGKPFVFGPVGGGQVAPMGFRRYLRGGWLAEIARTIFVRYLTPFFLAAKSTVSNASLTLVANLETRAWVERIGTKRVEFMLDVGTTKAWLADSPRLRDRDDTLRILWIGRLLPRKAVLLALEALSRIDRKIEFSCTILGDGEQGHYLNQWIRQIGLSDRVVWRGKVPWAEAIEAYRHHDVLLFTSLRDTNGTQLLEAMAHGEAIVTLDHQGARTVVPNSAGIKVPVTTPPETADALARALTRLAREPETLATMKHAAVCAAAEHEWSRKVKSAVALYPLASRTD